MAHVKFLHFLLSIVPLICISSCINKHQGEQKTSVISNFVSITDNEDKGIKDILGFCGGRCEYGRGQRNGKRFFSIELSKSAKIEKYADRVEMPASNAVYLFFRNLKDECKNYDEIHTKVNFADGSNKEFFYSTDSLQIVKSKFELLKKVVALIGHNDFESLKRQLDATIPIEEQIKLIAGIQKYQTTLGNVRELVPFGFKFYTSNGETRLHLSGIVTREIQNNELALMSVQRMDMINFTC